MTVRVRIGAFLVASGVVAGGVSFVASPVAYPAVEPTSSTPHVSLASEPATVTPGSALSLGLQIDGDVQNLSVRTVVHDRVTTRSGFDRTLDGSSLGRVASRKDTPVGSLEIGDDGTRTLSLATTPSRAGVYPLEVELRDPSSGSAFDHFVTYLVAAAPGTDNTSAISEPLSVAWVWRLVATPVYLPDGKPDPGVVADLRSRVSLIANTLPDASSIAMTLAPNPETAQSWSTLAATDADLAQSLKALTSSSRSHQVLSGPYVPIDGPALIRNGLGAEIGNELASGKDALEQELSIRADQRTMYVETLNDATLAELRDAGVDRLIVPSSTLQSVSAQLTPARPFTIVSPGRLFAVAAVDEGLSQLIEGDDPPALRAQRLLAGLSLVALEQPNERRGVVIGTPQLWNPSRELLDAVLTGLKNHPLLQATSVDTLLDNVPPEKNRDIPVVRTVAAPATVPIAVDARAFRATEADLLAFTRLVGVTDPRVERGQRALHVSLSSFWKGGEGRTRASAELDSVNQSIQSFASQIRAPAGRTVTLTARSADIPLSFQNNSGRAVRVRIKLTSDKLFFPDGSQREVELPPRNTTIRFPVEARASGTFPVVLTMSSDDGQLVLQRSRLTIRSTVFSGVGLFLTIGAILFLAIWWLTHFRKHRRNGPRPRGARGAVRAPQEQPA